MAGRLPVAPPVRDIRDPPSPLGHVIYCGAMGFFAGFALRKVGRVVAIGVGLAFAASQIARYAAAEEARRGGAPVADDGAPPLPPAVLQAGYTRALRLLDADGDGVVSSNDLSVHGTRLAQFVGAPAGAAMAGGLLMGLRHG